MTNTNSEIDELQRYTETVLNQFFPKGKCKERGQALVMYAEMLIRIKNNFRIIPKTDLPEKWVELDYLVDWDSNEVEEHKQKKIFKNLKWRGEK